MQTLQPLTIGTRVIHKSNFDDVNPEIGIVLSSVSPTGQVMVDWPGFPHPSQSHPIYRPRMKPVSVANLRAVN